MDDDRMIHLIANVLRYAPLSDHRDHGYVSNPEAVARKIWEKIK